MASIIRYLSYIYDIKKHNAVDCTSTSLQLIFGVNKNEIAKDLKGAFRKKLITTKRSMYYVLTDKGEEYVEGYRSKEASNRANEEQPQKE